MKALIISVLAMILLPLYSFGYAKKDTISIDFGNNSKIIIYVNSQNDLKVLQQYDINQMLKDLHLAIDSADTDLPYLKIEDNSGTKYLKDTTLIFEYVDAFQFVPEGYQKEIPIGGFHHLNIGSTFEALIKKSSDYRVVLSGKEEDVEDVVATLKGDQLEIKYQTSIRNRKSRVKIYIEMPELSGVNLSGIAKVNAVGFESSFFEADVSGAAKLQAIIVTEEAVIDASGASRVKLVGNAEKLFADASGAAEIDASEFETTFAKAEASGAAKIRINSNDVDSYASGAGNIRNNNQPVEEIRRKSGQAHSNNYFRIKIGKYEFSVPKEGWEDFDKRFEDVESLEDLEDKIDKKEYVQEEIPRVKHSLNFEFGMNNYLQEGGFPETEGALYSVKPWGSWYLGVNSIHKFHVVGPLFLDWGKGISWYNYKFDNPDVRVIRMEQGVGFEEDPRGHPGIKSKITASYLNMSLVPLFDFSQGLRRVKSYSMEGFNFTQYNKRGFRIGVGGYAGYRVGSHTKYVFKDDRRQREKDRGNFFLNNWRYGVRGQLGFKALDLFFNYDLSPLYVGQDSPELQPFSFGVIF